MFRTALSLMLFSCVFCAVPSATLAQGAQSKGAARSTTVKPSTAIVNLNTASVTDLAPEFKLAAGSSVTLDNSQAPVMVDGKFWYWVNGAPGTTGTVSIIWLKDTWIYTKSDGTEAHYGAGAYQDADNLWQGEAAATSSVPVFMMPYIDLRLVPSTTGEINDATLASFAASGVTLFRNGTVQINRLTPGTNQKSYVSLGDGKVRMFFDPTGIQAGT